MSVAGEKPKENQDYLDYCKKVLTGRIREKNGRPITELNRLQCLHVLNQHVAQSKQATTLFSFLNGLHVTDKTRHQVKYGSIYTPTMDRQSEIAFLATAATDILSGRLVVRDPVHLLRQNETAEVKSVMSDPDHAEWFSISVRLVVKHEEARSWLQWHGKPIPDWLKEQFDPGVERGVVAIGSPSHDAMELMRRIAVLEYGYDPTQKRSDVTRFIYNDTYAMSLGDVGERTGWSALRTRGLAMAVGRRPLEHLANWLQTGGEDLMHAVSHRGGWNLGAYVLPSGEVIGVPSKPLFYNGDTSHAHAYRALGTIAGWRDSVSRLCAGNSRPMLAIGAALAAPLLHLVGLESGGFHLFGPSGCGKTTSANVGASVWGLPREQVLNWDATALALANAAAACNDGLMLLDEIGQGNPEAVSMAAYRLFNGTGKMQGAREGGNREMLRWRVLVISTGEVDLNSVMQGGGRRVRAGQEVRLASMPADAGAGLGCFERLNGKRIQTGLQRHSIRRHRSITGLSDGSL